MVFYYTSWCGEIEEKLVFGNTISIEKDEIRLFSLIGELSKVGYKNAQVVSFRSVTREFIRINVGEEGLKDLEDRYRKNTIKTVQ